MRAKNRFATAAFVGVICALASAWPAAARTIYVDDDAPGDPGPGNPAVSDPLEDGSAEHPFDAIQEDINAAVAGDTVLVADGTYTGAGNKNLDFGGKAITVQSASDNPAACIIDCQGSGRGFYFHSGETAASVVAGLTIRNGKVTSSTPGGPNGGAVYCSSSSNPTLVDCIISGNTSSPCGGGVACASSSPTLIGCAISGNTTTSAGGGIYFSYSSNPTLINCAVIANAASAPYSGNGGGLWCGSSSPTLTNCTVAWNRATFGGAVYCTSSSSPKLTNCVLWGDESQEIYVHSSAPVVTYCDVQGGYAGAGNLNVDPGLAFVGDFHLTAGSPCIDAGTSAPGAGLPAQDYDGDTRVLDGNADGLAIVDIGADEFNPVSPVIALSPTPVEFILAEGQSNSETQTLFVRNAGGGVLDWALAWDAPWLQACPMQGESAGEVDTVTLTANAGALSHGVYSTMLTAAAPQAVNGPGRVRVVLYVGQTLHVPGTYATIQAAIDAASTGDTVLVADGIYAGTGNKSIDYRGKAITVRSASANPAACIIDCQGSGRGLYFQHHETAASVLAGFTIRNANDTGVCCYQSSPTLANCVISENTSAYYNGGVYCFSSASPTLMDCVISGNSGAGVQCDSSANACLIRCTISGNQGGGVSCSSSSPTLSDCIISGNSGYQGAGVSCVNAPCPTLTNCTISGNTASYAGGGLHCAYSNPRLTHCTIMGNTASYGSGSPTGAGGGVYCAFSSPTLANCTIRGNVAANSGGGIESDYSSAPMLTNCTISGNTAVNSAGGMVCYSSTPTLTNCILWGDTPQEIYVSSSTPVVTYCDVQGGYTGTGNLNLNPLFVNAAAGNYHLSPLSPCIDRGDPTSDFSLEPEPDGGRINMGAYGNTPEAETKGWIYIDGYNIVRKTRVGRTLFEYDLTTTVRNASSQGVTNLVATLLAAPANVQVIDNTVNVGSVPAASTVESADTFTIRVDRTTLVSPLPISWRVTYGSGFAEFTTLLDLGNAPQPGDVNCDGRVDFDDINPFVLALTGAEGYYSEYPECDWLNADCNEDGSVDFDDINAFVVLLTQ